MAAVDFPFVTSEVVRFRDMDAYGHINNAVYLTYLESARTYLFRQMFDDGATVKTFPFILGEITCRYLAPGFLPDTLTVGIGVAKFGRKSLTLSAAIDSAAGHTLAVSHATIVMYDYSAEKTIIVPDSLKERITRLQGDWVAPVYD